MTRSMVHVREQGAKGVFGVLILQQHTWQDISSTGTQHLLMPDGSMNLVSKVLVIAHCLIPTTSWLTSAACYRGTDARDAGEDAAHGAAAEAQQDQCQGGQRQRQQQQRQEQWGTCRAPSSSSAPQCDGPGPGSSASVGA